MATREGRKTPTGSEIDDWFDLLEEESPAPIPSRAPVASTPDPARVVPPAESSSDSWDWDMETPVVSLPPPVEAHDEEFTDFGGQTPVAGPSASVGASVPPGADVARRFQGTMMFGSTPQPPTPPLPPAGSTEAPPAPSASTASPAPRSVSPSSLRPRTPVPRAPVSLAVPQAFPLPTPSGWVSPQTSVTPLVSAPAVTPADLDDLEFEDVSTARPSVPSSVGRRVEKSTHQRATPVVPVLEVSRAQLTPVVQHSVPAEARRSPLPPRPSSQHRSLMPPSTRREMIDRFDLGDFTGALSIAETLLEIDRTDGESRHIAESSRAKLHAIYLGRLGALDQVPVMMIPHAELRWLALDHRAGFVLSLVDGTSSIEEIVDVSTMPELEVLRTIYNLLSQNVVSLRRPRR